MELELPISIINIISKFLEQFNSNFQKTINPKNGGRKNTVKWAFFEGDFSKFADESSILSERINIYEFKSIKEEICRIFD